MSRLTELIDIDGMEIKTAKERPLSKQGLGAILHKLYALEDLEEQLGCPLEVVVKALQEELEYIANGVRIEGTLSQIYYSIGGYWMGEFVPKGYILGEREYLTKRIPLKDYGKTWWLKNETSI